MTKRDEAVELENCVCCQRPIYPGNGKKVPEGWIHRTKRCRLLLDAKREQARLAQLKEMNGGEPLSPEIY